MEDAAPIATASDGEQRDTPPANAEDERVDQIPLPGTLLLPGDYLVELEFARPVTEETLLRGLAAMGFGPPDRVVVDQSLGEEPKPTNAAATPEIVVFWDHWQEWGVPGDGMTTDIASPVRYRFVGRLTVPIRIVNLPEVRWLYVYRATIDPFAPVAQALLEPYRVKKGRTYELYFFVWMITQPRRQIVCESLALMGWKPLKVSALKKNCRLPGRPGASMTLWYAIARWEGEDSYVTLEDPFIFENVQAIDEREPT